jgi:hypothetical protein
VVGATEVLGGSAGPGGLADKISKTDAAICLLAKLTRSPKLEFKLVNPKDASLNGSELASKTPSGCQSIAGMSLSCQEGKPCSLQL